MHRRSAACAALALGAGALAQPPARGPEPDAPPKKAPTEPVSAGTTVRVRASAWVTSLEGHAAVGQAIPGTISTIDLIEDLNLDPDRTAFQGAIGVNLSKDLHFDVGYAGPFSFDGTSDPIDISFNDLRFTGVVTTEAELDLFQVDLAIDLIEAGAVTVSIGPGLRIFDFEAAVSGTASSPGGGGSFQTTETVDVVAPLPGASLGVRIDLTRRLYVEGGARGMYLGDYGNYFDATGGAGIRLHPPHGGVRRVPLVARPGRCRGRQLRGQPSGRLRRGRAAVLSPGPG